MKVLITGGAGYIGSTIAMALIEAGHTPIILDSLVKGRIEFTQDKIFYKGDIADKTLLQRIFTEHQDIYCMIHCAGLIVVPESVASPFEYYTENVEKTIKLFKYVIELGCRNIVFSSSASVYEDEPSFMVTETSKIHTRSPYARTKQMVELILEDYCRAYNVHGIALRYFNPIGADPKLRCGSYIKNPSHVLGKMLEASKSKENTFYITGTNYATRDGSGIRDYIHVWDLARAHVKAVENLEAAFEKSANNEHFIVINLGTGKGVTVKELVKAYENVIGHPINKAQAPARPGDVPGAYANCDKALELIGWKAELSIEQGISDALRWDKVRDSIINKKS
jgi:UDP-glucose 4-epimerase